MASSSARKKKVSLPRYDGRRGWIGGDSRTLYAFTDRRTGRVAIYPGGGAGKKLLMPVGPEANVRVATRSEAEAGWQDPLHAGWTVHATRKAGMFGKKHQCAAEHAAKKKYPYIAYWIRSRGPGSQRDSVPIYVLGTTTRADEGIVGHDLRVRPLRLGKGAYTTVVSPDDVEDKP